MVARGISKTGVTISIPAVVQAGGTAVLGGSTVAISAEVVAAATVAASEVIIVSSLAVGEVALVFCSANENASVQVKNSSSAVKKISGRGSKAVSNMKEFFCDVFGKSIKNNLSKTKLQYDGQPIYKVTSKSGNEYLKKGYGVYLDALHKDHLEVIDKAGKVKYFLNLDGTLNADKTAKAIGRTIKGW